MEQNEKIPYICLINKQTILTKSKLKEQIKLLPEKFSIDELIDRLILIEKIEIGEKQSINKEVISEDEFNKEIEKWFK